MADIFEDGFVDFSDSVYRDFNIRDITPFKSSVRTNYAVDGSISNYVYSFSQAYVVTNSPADSRASGLISGMGNEFVIPEDEDIEFQVKVTLDKQNYKIIGTEFLTGEPSQEGENTGNFTHPVFDYKTEDSEGDFQLIYPVCSVRNGNLVNYTVRDNIYVDKTQLKQLGPTGAAENGTGGQVHLIVESGYTDPSLPIRFRGISGGSGVQVRYDVDNASGGNFIIIDASGAAGGGGGGVGSCANVGDAADVYVEGTDSPFNFRSLTGAKGDNGRLPDNEIYVVQDGNVIRFSGQGVHLSNTGNTTSSVKIYHDSPNETGPVTKSKAAFREIDSPDSSVGIGLTNSDNTISIEYDSGKYKPYYNWTGENVGSQTAIYVDGTGPVASNEAQFRSLKSSDSSVGIGLTDSDNVIDITTDLQKTTDGGNTTTNDINLNGSKIYFDGDADKSLEGDTDDTLLLGIGVTNLKSKQADVVSLFPDNSVAMATMDYSINATSPATGAVIIGGTGNRISGHYNVITAGVFNKISGKDFNFIGGGSGNDVNFSQFSSSLGGRNNDISGANYSVLLGGDQNLIKTGHAHFLGGGVQNKISGSASIISNALVGGTENKILDATYSFIGAGATNTIYANNSVIGGGTSNIASGDSSVIMGGSNNKVLADYGLAAGRYSTVQENHDGAFVLSDSNTSETLSSGANTLTLNFKSGVYVDSDSGIYINGNPVLTGVSGSEGDTLQIVTDRGATTTNAITLQNNLTLSYNYPRINLTDTDNDSDYSIINNDGSFGIYDVTNTAYRLQILSGGNVGIGTDTPSARLHVNGPSAGFAEALRLQRAGGNYYSVGLDNSRVNFVYNSQTTANSTLVIDGPNTRVGIGTHAPRTTLHVSKAGTTEGGIITIDNPNTTDGSYCGIEFINSTFDYPRSAIFAQRTGGAYDAELTFHTSPTNEITGTDYPAATERMRIDHDGRVGIGTNIAPHKLSVKGTISRLNSHNIQVVNLGVSTEHGQVLVNNSGGSPKALIDSNGVSYLNGGNVGIGSATPAFELDVVGTIHGTSGNFQNGITIDGDLLVQNNGQVRANGAGSLTLGNTNGGTIYVSGDGGASVISPRFNHLYLESTRDEDDIIFQAGEADVEMARFDSANQRFGIGTNNPQSRLHIGNATGSTLGLRFTNPTETVNQYFSSDATDSDFFITYAGNGGAEITLQHDGKLALNASNGDNVGVGTDNPARKLEVSEGSSSIVSQFKSTAGTSAFISVANTTATADQIRFGSIGNDLVLSTNYTERFRIDSAGNVGIAADDPQCKLQINHPTGSLHSSFGNLSIFSSSGQNGLFLGITGSDVLADRGWAFQVHKDSVNSAFAIYEYGLNGERFRIATQGNVGIGSSAPQGLLDVKADTDQDIFLGRARFGSHVTDYLYLSHYDNATSTSYALKQSPAGSTAINAKASMNVSMNVNNSPIVFVKGSNSRVGIGGITTPSGNLHIQGGAVAGYVSDTYADLITESADSRIQVVSDNGGSNGSALILTNVDAGTHSNWAFGQTTTAQGNKLHIGHNTLAGGDTSNYTSTQDLTLTTDGKVGIGSFSPAYVLDAVFAGDQGARLRSTDNHSSLLITSASGYGGYIRFGDGPNRYWINATSDDKLRFRPNATSLESATINFDATGNVGIGVLSPSEKLEVGTNTDVSAHIGRAHVGYVGHPDFAGFSHIDAANTTNYALLSSPAGSTYLNKASSQQIYFRSANSDIGGFNASNDFYVDTDTLYVDASEDRVGINDSTPSYALDVNGTIRTQSELLGTQFGTGPCTTIDGFFASTSTEDYGYQNALVLNDLAGFTKWAGVTIATSGLYKTRGGSAGSYTYSNEAGTGDFDRAFQANNNTVGSWYTDSGPDGDITTGAANSGSVELYFNGVKSLNYSAQAAVIFGSNPFRATHVKIEALRTGAWQTIVDTTGNDKTAIIARINSNGGGANATTGLRYTFAKAGSYFRINNFYAADYDLGNDLSYGGQYYIDKYYDGRHYSTLRPVTDGGANLGTSSVRYGSSYIDYGRFTNAVGIGTDTLTYNLNVVSNSDILAHFKSTDNKASILLQDDDTAAYVSVENNILALGPQNGTHATQNLNYNVTNYRLGIGTNVPQTILHTRTSDNQTARFESTTTSSKIYIIDATLEGKIGVNDSIDTLSLGFEASEGDQPLHISTGGNVGIGTASPISRLNIKSSATSSEDSALTITQNGGSNTIFAVGERATNGAQMLLFDGGTATHAFYTDGTDNYINAGNVGIGTTTPSTMLHVEGTGTFHSVDITGTSTLTVSGKVGIGEVSPDKSLHIVGNDVNGELIKLEGDASYGATIQYGRSINYLWRAGVGGGSSTNSKIPTSYWGIEDVTSSDTPSIVCRPINQYVGVKNTNPQYELDVSGTIHGTSGNFENGITIDGNPVVTGTSAFESDTLQTVTDQGNITSNDIGAGTITGNTLVITGANSTFKAFEQANDDFRIGTDTADDISIITNGSRRLTVTDAGNIGIGDATPIGDLQIGTNVFSGANGVHADNRIGLSVNGSLKSMVYASTYNNATYPDYGMVFIHGPNTSDYNVWSISPDGPAKGSGLNFIYRKDTTNIHITDPKVYFNGDGSVGIGTKAPDAHLNVYNTGTTSSVADVHILGSGNTYGLLVERLTNDSLIVSKSTTAGSYFKTDSATASFQGYEIGSNWFIGQYGYNDLRILDGSKSAGTAAITIQDSTQNIGIGTTNPVSKLTVESTANALADVDEPENHHLLLRNPANDTTEGVGMAFLVSALTDDVGAAIVCKRVGNSAQSELQFWNKQNATADGIITQSMTIAEDGNVGIGTTDPSEKLTVDGNIRINGDSREFYFAGNQAQIRASSASTDITFVNSSTELVRFASDGNVGINQTNPTSRLDVKLGDGTSAEMNSTGLNNLLTLRAGNNEDPASVANAGAKWGMKLRGFVTDTSNPNRKTAAVYAVSEDAGAGYNRKVGMALHTSPFDADHVERVRIDCDGLVGIATGDPQSRLHVYGDAVNNASHADYGIAAFENVNKEGLSIGYDADDNYTYLYSREVGVASRGLRLNGSIYVDDLGGDVGIGTTGPSAKLHVAGGNILVDSQYGIRFNDANTRIYTNAETPEDLIVEADQDLHLDPDGVVKVDTAEFQITSSAAFTTHLNYQNLGNNYISQANGGATIFRNSAGTLMSLNSAGTLNAGAAGVTNTRLHVTGAASDSLARFKDGDDGVEITTRGSSRQQIDFLGSNTSSINAKGSLHINYDTNNDGTNDSITFARNGEDEAGTADMVITEGKIGINDTSPANMLSVSGDASSQVAVAKITRQQASASNNTYTFEVDSSAHTSNMTLGGAMAVDVNAGRAFTINGFGRVGIGTTNPAAFLEVSKDNSNAGNQFVVADTEGTTAGIRTYTVSDPQGIILNHYYAEAGSSNEYARYADIVSNISNGAGSKIRFITKDAANTYFTSIIDNSGRFGIGTTDPQEKLHVDEGFILADGASTNHGFELRRDSLDTFQIRHLGGNFTINNLTDNRKDLSIDGNGNVGIGTDNPQRELEIHGAGNVYARITASTDNDSAALELNNNGNAIWTLKADDTASDSFKITHDSAGTALTIDTSKNVGIGTDSPAALLSVGGGDSAPSLGGGTMLTVDMTQGAGNYASMAILAGNAGRSSLFFGDSDAEQRGAFDYRHADDSLSISTAASEKIRITSAGNVGIGTTSPSNALDVIGHFSASSKSFLIDHPTKENKKLQYGSLEGPENGVYVRGTTNEETIELPEYWSELVHDESITVVLTPIGKKQDLFIIKKSNKLIKIGGVEGSYDYVVYGERKDIDRLEVEPDGN